MEEFDTRRAAMDLITAFVSNNKLDAAELPALLTKVFNAISAFGTTDVTTAATAAQKEVQASAPASVEARGAIEAEPEAPLATAAPKSAVSIEESISNPDFIISLITGEKFRTLKRHLRGNGLTGAEYRQRYNLPADYPLVAPSYSEMRRKMAQKIGLGRVVTGKAEAPKSSQQQASVAEAAGSARTKRSAATAPKARPSRSRAQTRVASSRGAQMAASEQEAAPPVVADSAKNRTAVPTVEKRSKVAKAQRWKAAAHDRRRATAANSSAAPEAPLADATPASSEVSGTKKVGRRKRAMMPEAAASREAFEATAESPDNPSTGQNVRKSRRKLSAIFG